MPLVTDRSRPCKIRESLAVLDLIPSRRELGMTDESRFSYFFLGLGLGTAVGMLVAPKAGTQTRNDIRGKVQEGTNYVKRQGQELLDSATETLEHGKQTLRNQMNNLSEAVAAGRKAYQEIVDNGPSHGT